MQIYLHYCKPSCLSFNLIVRQIYIINSVDKTKFLCTTPPPTQHHSFFRNYPLYSREQPISSCIEFVLLSMHLCMQIYLHYCKPSCLSFNLIVRQIYIINSVDKTKFLCTTPPPTQHHSFFRNYPLYSREQPICSCIEFVLLKIPVTWSLRNDSIKQLIHCPSPLKARRFSHPIKIE